MMTEPAIKVEHVFKKYSRNAGKHLEYDLWNLLREMTGQHSGELRKDEFYAANDVSFELQPGDSFALIGRNGSGKTTVLKMLNGLIKLDGGCITMRGRVQALINLGAGFSPRLSGRENIYNSASLIGLSRRETNAVLDEIIDFSEIESFLDSPVGTYSSGMKARLGFAVAVNLKPDILLIDEILAVGDFSFQNKCFARMEQLKKNGVTIVLVSHSHAKVVQLCKNALWLHQGRVMATGPSQQTVGEYLSFLENIEHENTPHKATEQAEEIRIEERANLYGLICLPSGKLSGLKTRLSAQSQECNLFPIHSSVSLEYEFTLLERVENLHVTANFYKKDGALIAAIASLKTGIHKDIHTGTVRGLIHIPDFDLCPGAYVVVLPIQEGNSYLYRDVVQEFTVTGGGEIHFGIKDFTCTHTVEKCEVDQ